MPLRANEMTVRNEGGYTMSAPTAVLRKWKQARIQELKSRIFAGKSSLRDIDISITRFQQQKEDLEFGKKPELEGHIEMMELELEELKTTIDV